VRILRNLLEHSRSLISESKAALPAPNEQITLRSRRSRSLISVPLISCLKKAALYSAMLIFSSHRAISCGPHSSIGISSIVFSSSFSSRLLIFDFLYRCIKLKRLFFLKSIFKLLIYIYMFRAIVRFFSEQS